MLIDLLWHTGARISEALAIRVADLDTWGIRMPNLKQQIPTEKIVFVPPDFLARVRAYCEGKAATDVVIGRLADGQPMTRRQGHRIVTGAGQRAGIGKKRFRGEELRPPWPHSLRHATAVHMLNQGVPVNAVQAQLGHSSLASTQVYTQITDPHRRQLVSGVRF